MRRGATALLSMIALIPLLAGCATDPAPATGETTSSPTPRPEESTARQSGEGSGSGLVFTDVRAGAHQGFDRIVLEFTGTGTPGYVVNYVDEPVLEGSGDVVDLGGSAALDIYASGTTWPAPGYYDGPTQFTPRDGGEVDDLYVGGTVEGYTQVLAGIDGDPVPLRVSTLTAPSRLVIDLVRSRS